MDQGVVVEKFDRRGGILRVLSLATDSDCGCEAHERTNPLAARPDGIAHGLGEHCRTERWQHLGKRLFD